MSDPDWDNVDETFVCPVCGKEVILPAGPKNSPILLVSDEPSDTEIGEGIPFVGQYAGVLRSELGLHGLDMRAMRRMTMWQHKPAKGKDNPNKACLAHGIQQVVKEAKGRQIVVLFGANTCKNFLGVGADEVSGLRMKSEYLSAIVLPCVAIGSVFSSGVGEIRFALKELETLVKELDLYPSNEQKGKKSSQAKAEPMDEEIEDW
jgi:uracil-DNA glycosylase